MRKQLLILMALFISVLGYSQTFTDNYIDYEVIINTTTVKIIDYNTSVDPNAPTDVDIPSTVTYNSIAYSVVRIDSYAFSNNQLTSVVIPDTVILIFSYAFAANQLTTVTIPDGVLSIGSNSFWQNQLTSITIPNSVTNIGSQAFTNNPLISVTSLAIVPPTITTGTNDTFNSVRSNIALNIPTGTMDIYVTNPNAGADWSGFNPVTEALVVGDTFIVDFITYEVTSVTPGTVEAIDYDFSGGTIVNIPATVPFSVTTYDVTSIGNSAFLGSIVTGDQLTSVTIPNSILSLGENAFNGNNLTDITIPDSVTSIGGQAFAFNDLVNANIGNNVVDIANSTFRNNQLTSIIIPAGVTSIGTNAFGNNPLNAVIDLATTPPTIFTGTNDSFANDRSNINLILTGNTTDEYVTDNGALWTGFKMVFEATSATTAKVTDYDAANGTVVSIPAVITIPSVAVFNVTEIGDSAFFDKGITSVTIPDSITDIGISAFDSNNLTDVTIPDNVTVIGTTAFQFNSITNLSLGNNVEIIGIGAFINNNLTDITIPSNVTNIDLLAFGNNPLLASVTSLAIVPPTITTGPNDTFIFDRSNTALHIPAGTMGAYVTDAGALWTGFNPVTEDALSVSDFELANDVKVITTTDAIKVIASNNIRLENYTVYSISGSKVTTGIETKIATASLARGIYILKLDFDKGTIVKKVVVN